MPYLYGRLTERETGFSGSESQGPTSPIGSPPSGTLTPLKVVSLDLNLWGTQVETCHLELSGTAGREVSIWGYCLQQVVGAVGGMKLPGHTGGNMCFAQQSQVGAVLPSQPRASSPS